MNSASSLIDRSISHNETVIVESTSRLAASLSEECDDSVDNGDSVEYWGERDGSEWRVHLSKPAEVTEEQVRVYLADSQENGDDEAVVIATIALELEADEYLTATAFEDRFGGCGLRVHGRALSRVLSITAAEAWDECARAIRGERSLTR